jgi:hypothetical protein
MWGNLAVAGLGAASSLMGASSAKSAARDQRRLANDQLRIAGTAYSPINVFGPGGGGITFGTGFGGSGGFSGGSGGYPEGTGIKDLGGGFRQVGRQGLQSNISNINASLGDLDPLRQALVGAGGQVSGNLGLQGLSPLQLLGLGLAGQSAGGPDMDLGTLDALSGLFGSTTGSTFNQFNQQQQNPFQQQLMEQLFQGAGGQFADASRGFEDYRASTLDTLRQQAQPFEERAFSSLQDNLFATGRMGTSGGGLQMESFARGLGQADLSRQLAAGQEARAAQQNALGVGTGLASQGSGIAGLQDSLLNNAFGRFGQSAEFSRALSGDRYARTLGGAQFGIDAGRGLFGLGQDALTSPYAVQGAALGNLGQILGGVGDLQQQAFFPAQIAGQFMGAQANTRLGQAGFFNNPGLTAPQNMNANMWSQLGGALLGSRAGQQGISSIFGGLNGLFNRQGNVFGSAEQEYPGFDLGQGL